MPSSVIGHARYDADTSTLSLWFLPSGRRYDYQDVPPEAYEAFRASPSKGRHFNRHIRDAYAYRLVSQPIPAPAPTPPANRPYLS